MCYTLNLRNWFLIGFMLKLNIWKCHFDFRLKSKQLLAQLIHIYYIYIRIKGIIIFKEKYVHYLIVTLYLKNTLYYGTGNVSFYYQCKVLCYEFLNKINIFPTEQLIFNTLQGVCV